MHEGEGIDQVLGRRIGSARLQPAGGHGPKAPWTQTLRVCTLGFGSLNHGIWPFIKVFGTQQPRVTNIRVQTSEVFDGLRAKDVWRK